MFRGPGSQSSSMPNRTVGCAKKHRRVFLGEFASQIITWNLKHHEREELKTSWNLVAEKKTTMMIKDYFASFHVFEMKIAQNKSSF